jgi:hypothetical protein
MPERWLARLDQREEIERIARDLFHLSCSFGLH